MQYNNRIIKQQGIIKKYFDDKRLAIRTNGKCLSGVKKAYLMSTHPIKDKINEGVEE